MSTNKRAKHDSRTSSSQPRSDYPRWRVSYCRRFLLRSPSEPGARVKKAMYKPGRNWVSTTPTNYYIYYVRPRALLSTLRHLLVSSSLHYVTILS